MTEAAPLQRLVISPRKGNRVNMATYRKESESSTLSASDSALSAILSSLRPIFGMPLAASAPGWHKIWPDPARRSLCPCSILQAARLLQGRPLQKAKDWNLQLKPESGSGRSQCAARTRPGPLASLSTSRTRHLLHIWHEIGDLRPRAVVTSDSRNTIFNHITLSHAWISFNCCRSRFRHWDRCASLRDASGQKEDT